MYNKEIIERIKDMRLDLKKFKSGDGEHLSNIANKIKVYIFGLQLDKKDENFRKGIINMIDEYRAKIRSRHSNDNINIKYNLRNILESVIDVMELKEEDLEAEENDSGEEEKPLEAKENDIPEEGKKSKANKKKSD